MALSQSQWYEKLRYWLPQDYIEDESIMEAVYQGIAALLSAYQSDSEETQTRTFIDQALGADLDTHGGERGINRKPDEISSIYRDRIKAFGANLSRASIVASINAILPPSSPAIDFEPLRRDGPFWEEVFFGTTTESFVFRLKKSYNWWYLYLPEILFEATTGDVTLAEGAGTILPRLEVSVGDTYTVNDTLFAYEIINNGTIVADTIAPGVIISGTGTTTTNGEGGSIVLLTKEKWYGDLIEAIESLKALGTTYDIWSEEF